MSLTSKLLPRDPMIFAIASADLTFEDGRVLNVPIREDAGIFVPCWFGQPTPEPGSCPGYRMLMVIDGRMYRDIVDVTYIDKRGTRQGVLKE